MRPIENQRKGIRNALGGFLFLIVLPPMAGAREAIWIEGEAYASSSFNQHGWYQNTNITKGLLSPGIPGESDGNWHTHFTNAGSEEVTALYRFTILEGGRYSWWIRLNPFRNANGGANYSFRYQRVRGSWSPWQDLDVSEARAGMVDLVDPGIDIRFIAWSFGGTFELTGGVYELEIRLMRRQGDQENHGGIDVMALVNFPWSPAGTTPPDPRVPESKPDAWFPLMAGPDPFSADSIIDMSSLIEKPAGKHGVLTAPNKDFAFADGTAVKFWGIDASMTETIESQERQAKFYAKHGINMVRQHPVESVLGSPWRDGNTLYFDPVPLDRLDRWFSILKSNGIHMTWSIFYHHVVLPDEGIDSGLYNELPDEGRGKDTYGLATFIQEYQDSQWHYARLLLNHVNPYTKLAYKDDPALAIVEARNEDGVFFHNPLGEDFVCGKLCSRHSARLKQMWQQWVKKTYGTDAALATAWGAGLRKAAVYNSGGSLRSQPDSVNETNMYLYAAWEMEKDGPRWNKASERKRMGDYIRFLAEMQRQTYETYRQRLRDLGFKGVTVSTAWMAGGPAASAANLWTDDAMHALDRHNYRGGGAGDWAITLGNVNNQTHLGKPGSGILCSGMWQVEDKPFIMTEWTQMPPNQWKAEIAPLVAFYGMGLQGWDASFQFAGSRSYMGDGWPGMSSFVTETPHYIGQFPALAFAIYQKHFTEGASVAARRLSLAQAFAGTDALSQQYGTVSNNEMDLLAEGTVPVDALAVGRVTLKVANGQAASQYTALSAWIDTQNRKVRSNTAQLTWDYGYKVVMVHSDKTQGLIGFAAGRTYILPAVTVEKIATPFISLLFTPLDNRPLIESRHILITAMARDKQLGTVYNDDGTELLETGGPPLLLEPVQATITLKGGSVTSVKVVDVYGVPTDRQVERTGNTFRLDGRYATYYYEIRR
jgi:hypothetical protein